MIRDKILVVEDEPIVAKDLQNILSELGYKVPIIVSSGEEAIVKTEEINPDLILMDITLNGEMSGIEAASKIKNNFDIPIVYLTAHKDEDSFNKAKISEPSGYIVKPFHKEELRRVIELSLHNSKKEELRKVIKLSLHENKIYDKFKERENVLRGKEGRMKKLMQEMYSLFKKNKLGEKMMEEEGINRKEFALVLIDSITDLQEELSKSDPKTHTNTKGEKFRSPFVHAETLKGIVMQMGGIKDGR